MKNLRNIWKEEDGNKAWIRQDLEDDAWPSYEAFIAEPALSTN